MGRVGPRPNNKIAEHETLFPFLNKTFIMELNPLCIRSAARTYTTLRGRLCGLPLRTEAHQGLRLLSVREGKAVVRFCETPDHWRRPVAIKILRQFSQSLLPKEHASTAGKR